MGQLRVEKVQEFIKQEISKLILNEVKDPRIGFVTVTNVEMTKDLRTAKVFVSLFGTDEQKKATWQGLTSSLGFFRTEIGKRIRLRLTPEISLHVDNSFEASAHIQKLLLDIKKEEAQPKKEEESGV
jgi:ribosome-binding factor A